MMGKMAQMETIPKSPTLVMVHHGIDSAMPYVFGFKCLSEEEFVSNWAIMGDSRHW